MPKALVAYLSEMNEVKVVIISTCLQLLSAHEWYGFCIWKRLWMARLYRYLVPSNS